MNQSAVGWVFANIQVTTDLFAVAKHCHFTGAADSKGGPVIDAFFCERRASTPSQSSSNCIFRRENLNFVLSGFDFSQWRKIVQNPKRSAVCGHNQVAIFNFDVVHRHCREGAFHSAPIFAIVLTVKKACLGPNEQQALAMRIGAHNTNNFIGSQVTHNGRPAFTAIFRQK